MSCEGKNYWGCSSTLKYGNRRLLGVFGGMPPGKFEFEAFVTLQK